MKNERGLSLIEKPNPKKKKELSYEQFMKKQAKDDAAKICPILQKDPDWPLASGKIPVDGLNYRKSMRALTRLTKKASQLLFPEYKVLSCHGSGTTYYWVYVNIVIPEKTELTEDENIAVRVKKMLTATGLNYGSYYTDYGPNNSYKPCLSVNVNDLSWGHH